MSSDRFHLRHIFHSNPNRAHFFDCFLTESLLAAIICLDILYFIEINFSVDFVGRWNFGCLPKCTILMLTWWWLTMWNRKKAFSTCKYDIIEYALLTMEHFSLFGKSQHFHDNKIVSFAYFFFGLKTDIIERNSMYSWLMAHELTNHKFVQNRVKKAYILYGREEWRW